MSMITIVIINVSLKYQTHLKQKIEINHCGRKKMINRAKILLSYDNVNGVGILF